MKGPIAKAVASATSLLFLWLVWLFLDGLFVLPEVGAGTSVFWLLGGTLVLIWLAVIKGDTDANVPLARASPLPYPYLDIEEEEEELEEE